MDVEPPLGTEEVLPVGLGSELVDDLLLLNLVEGSEQPRMQDLWAEISFKNDGE